MLALLAPLLALNIENLQTLNANPEDIINLHSGEPQPAMCFLSYITKLSSKHWELSSLQRDRDVENNLGEEQAHSEIKGT